jgi:predicted amidohydrolase
MNPFRTALANLRFPATPEESVTLAEQAIAQASIERARLICFPECFVPGYRGMGKRIPPPDPAFLERAWAAIAAAAAKASLAVVIGTERVVDGALLASALVIHRDGTIAGFQDKVQLDPSEERSIRRAPAGGFSKPAR